MNGPAGRAAFLPEPERPAWPLRLFTWAAERVTGRRMAPARLLAWYPRAAVGAGVLEALAPHPEGALDARLLKLVRLQASLTAQCAFCIDMNGADWRDLARPEELLALQTERDPEEVSSFSARERLAILYARRISRSPLFFPPDLIAELRRNFTEREMVLLAATAAQVNYWARLIQALGVAPAGFSDVCALERDEKAARPDGVGG